VALIPTLLFGIWNTGAQFYAAQGEAASFVACFLKGLRYVLPIIVVSYAAGGVWEVLFAVVRKHEINEGFLVTGLLVPLIVPPTIPLWQLAVGVSFGVVIGKEVFGGTGMNVFNPALVARAFLFFAYAPQMSGEVWAALPAKELLLDGYSGATPLAVAAVGAPAGETIVQALTGFGTAANGAVFADYSWWSCFLGTIPGSIGETSALACLIGAAILLGTGIGSWRIMASCVVGAVVMALLFNVFGRNYPGHFLALPAHYHLVMGGLAFGIVYMATDPVSAASTNTGKYIYGFLIGVLTVIIRTVNPAYPEGAMLAILFMNAFAPLIDYAIVNRHMARRLSHA
jgi:Na+-transporting NADH:ubiquinone oxidoreductase subunit B